LAMLQAYVENQGSGWDYTLEYLQRFFDTCLADVEASPGEGTAAPHAAYLALARTLGRRTAELHWALARNTGNPDFDPEPVREENLASWTQRVAQDLAATLDRLAARRGALPPELSETIARVLAARVPLLDYIAGLLPARIQAMNSRYHGDYHLGQVLVVENDFVITDFEGEPGRNLAERRHKHSPLRDVAGMLRSFNYAAIVALDRHVARRPDQRGALEPYAAAWEKETAASFLSSYRETISGCPSYPAEPRQAQSLIDLFFLEKALSELRYEQDNRPDWVNVPLRALLNLSEELAR